MLEDLVHAGILGTYGCGAQTIRQTFSSSTTPNCIRGAILDSLRQVDWSPRALRRQARRLEQAVLTAKLASDATRPNPKSPPSFRSHSRASDHLLGDLRGLDIGSLQADANDPNGDELATQNRAAADQEILTISRCARK